MSDPMEEVAESSNQAHLKDPIPASQEKPPFERDSATGTDHTHVEVPPENTPKDSEIDYPDGGLRAWLNVVGGVCLFCCSFGVVNSWCVFASLWLLLFGQQVMEG
jgi:MCP family monocarboxylic acid transporter-like MFS transporter 10